MSGIPGFDCSNDNGRYGGGDGGGENRYHFPGVDALHWDQAKVGARDDPDRGEGEVVPESMIGTVARPRGEMGGTELPRDRGGFT